MRYVVRKSIVDVVGRIWMPAIVCSMRKNLSAYDVENIRSHGNGTIDREAVDQWLAANSGDFQHVIDFTASIENGAETIDIPFATEAGETAYLDTLSTED